MNASNGIFAGLPIPFISSAMRPTQVSARGAKIDEPCTDSEHEALLKSSPENKATILLKDMHIRCAVCICVSTCTILTMGLTALIAVVYSQFNNVVYEVDSTVSIISTVQDTLSNVNTILKSTAALSQSVQLMSGKILNTTQEGLSDLHRLVEHPTITLAG